MSAGVGNCPRRSNRQARKYQESRLGRVSPHTADIDKYSLKHLVPVFGSCLLCDITAEAIARYQKKRQQEGAEGRTINMEVGVLRGVLTAHRMWEAVARDVHVLPERKDIGQALTPEQERRLLEETERRDSACHTATVLALNTEHGQERNSYPDVGASRFRGPNRQGRQVKERVSDWSRDPTQPGGI